MSAGDGRLKVGFNARLLHDGSLRGWTRYTVDLLAELPALGVDLVLMTQQGIHPNHLARLPASSFVVRLAPPMSYIRWEQRWVPRQCRADQVDLLHAPANYGLPWSSPCPRVLTLHDAIDRAFYARQPGPRFAWNPRALLSQFQQWVARFRAECVITVSEHAKGDLITYFGIPAERVRVTYEAADSSFHAPVDATEREQMRQRLGLARPYVFYVGGWELRKNIPFLIKAFAAAAFKDVDLVIAGGKEPQRVELSALADALGLSGRLHFLGWVDDAELPVLYAEALAFVYPSLYEGFGLQLCEAMAAGCPTLAARASCLPEVLGKGGETFALDDPAELVALLRRLASDPEFRASLAARARARSTAFSWRRTAEQTVAVYRELLGWEAGPRGVNKTAERRTV
jgi:glycosyltransferase involved in cell wall biosynthesis